jgi:putative ABC transport system permease protein
MNVATPRTVRVMLAAYRALACLLPGAFRDTYLLVTLDDFRTLLEAEYRRRGRWGAALTGVRSLFDLAVRIPKEHANERRSRRNRDHTFEVRKMRMGGWEKMANVLKDVRLAARGLARRPGFTAIAAVTLALGVGATVAIFTVVNSVLIQPLPYPEADRIVTVNHHAPGLDLPELQTSPGTLKLYREFATVFAGLAAFNDLERNLRVGDQLDRVEVVELQPSMFSVLRVQPRLGRAFTTDDGAEDAAPVAILTDATWKGRFGSDPAVLGRTIELDGVTTDIVGVMPAGFAFPDPGPVLLAPLYVDPEGSFGEFGMAALARLGPEVTLETARAQVADLQLRIPEMDPEMGADLLEQAGWSASLTPLREALVKDVRAALWIVLATVGFVLVISCANVANLFLVRAESRQKEIAIRAALGAGRRRLAANFLSESVLLGLLGGALGLLLAHVGVQALVAYGPSDLPRLQDVAIDGTVVAFATVISVVAGLLFGSIPMVRYLGGAFSALLRDGGRGSTDGRGRHRARNVLVASQLALALVLLVGSGLMLKSFAQLRALDLGFEPEGVLTVSLSLGEGVDRADAAQFYQGVVDEVRGLPGVTASAATNSLPIRPTGMSGGSFWLEARPREEGQLPPIAMLKAMSEGYLETIGIPLLEGRAMTTADQSGETPVVWVNETFARAYLDGDALGERVGFAGEGEWAEIVGVVGDAREMDLMDDIRPFAYLPMVVGDWERFPLTQMSIVVRTAGDPLVVLPAVRRIVREADSSVPLSDAGTMEVIVSEAMAGTSFTMTLLSIAATVALLLGAIGLFGVISYVVSQRTREIGVRVALGARGEDVQRMIVRQGVGVLIGGVVLGLGGAFALTRLMGAILYEVSATDPWAFAGAPVLLVLVSLLASWLPARRATKVDPVEALRAE